MKLEGCFLVVSCDRLVALFLVALFAVTAAKAFEPSPSLKAVIVAFRVQACTLSCFTHAAILPRSFAVHTPTMRTWSHWFEILTIRELFFVHSDFVLHIFVRSQHSTQNAE